MKVLGIVCVLLACTLMGYFFLWQEKQRIWELECAARAMVVLKNQILFLGAPLAEVLEAAAFRAEGIVRTVFLESSKEIAGGDGGSAEAIWLDCWRRHAGATYLTAEDLEAFFSYGKVLGYLDRRQQAAGIDLLLEYLERAAATQRKRLEQQGRLYCSSGLICGLLLVIVLL